MTGDLAQRVARLRAELEEIPDAITFADLPPGLSPGAGPGDLPAGLRALLEITNGPACGSALVFRAERVPDKQFYLADDLDGGPEAWLCFGNVIDRPLLLRRDTGGVWWYPDTGVEYWRSDRFESLAPTVPAFADHYLFGEGYATLRPGGDRWYEFLRRHSVALGKVEP